MTTPMDGVETTVDAFNVGPLTVERRSAPTKDDYGVYQPGPATTYVPRHGARSGYPPRG
jgi:hypothetical protein